MPTPTFDAKKVFQEKKSQIQGMIPDDLFNQFNTASGVPSPVSSPYTVGSDTAPIYETSPPAALSLGNGFEFGPPPDILPTPEPPPPPEPPPSYTPPPPVPIDYPGSGVVGIGQGFLTEFDEFLPQLWQEIPAALGGYAPGTGAGTGFGGAGGGVPISQLIGQVPFLSSDMLTPMGQQIIQSYVANNANVTLPGLIQQLLGSGGITNTGIGWLLNAIRTQGHILPVPEPPGPPLNL